MKKQFDIKKLVLLNLPYLLMGLFAKMCIRDRAQADPALLMEIVKSIQSANKS